MIGPAIITFSMTEKIIVRKVYKTSLIERGNIFIAQGSESETAADDLKAEIQEAMLLLMDNVHTKIVRGMLGYLTISLTLDTYSNVIPSHHEEAAEEID